MLKKMQRRFVGAAMAAFTAVILVLFCVVNAGNYRSVASQQDETLSQLLALGSQSAPTNGETPPDKPRIPDFLFRIFSTSSTVLFS